MTAIPEIFSYAAYLECARCKTTYPVTDINTYAACCNQPLVVKYDYPSGFYKEDLIFREKGMWRYFEVLPVLERKNIVTLGEGMTPLLPLEKSAAHHGFADVLMKDESFNPTGSFKARGLSAAVSKAKELGVQRCIVPTAGNAGGALAAYCAKAGIACTVVMPRHTPNVFKQECELYGAELVLVDGLISDCAKKVAELKQRGDYYDVSTLKEPYRLEGKKTMGLELAEQFDWELPDVILYPTGGGTGLIGMWKAFAELDALGWLKSARKPRMISCQSDGCAPIAMAFDKGERFAKKVDNAATIASGIRVPAAVGDFMILDAVRASGGVALATPEADIPAWMKLASSKEGIALCPEAAVCLGALDVLVKRGVIQGDERIVLFNTGAAQKYPETISEHLPRIDVNRPIDWGAI